MSNGYIREKAVQYAEKYALSPNPDYKYFKLYQNLGGDCTNFISQCLFAGGCPMNFNSQNGWWYKKSPISSENDTWSIPWAVAHSLYWFLKVNAEQNLTGPKGIETTDISSLEIGDLIFYEDYKNVIYHSTIITSFENGIPLIAQHTFEALNISYLKTYKAVKNHFLKIYINV